MGWIEKLARERGTGGWQTLDDMVRFGEVIAAAEREKAMAAILYGCPNDGSDVEVALRRASERVIGGVTA